MAVTFALILEAVAAEAGTTAAAIRGPSRMGGDRPENYPRRRALMLARRLLPHVSWRALSREMNRNLRNVAEQVQTAEERYAASPAERETVERVLRALGLAELPAYDPLQWRRARLDAEIRRTEAMLRRLRVERAELGEAA